MLFIWFGLMVKRNFELVRVNIRNARQYYQIASLIFPCDAPHVIASLVDYLLPNALRLKETQDSINKVDYYLMIIDGKDIGITGIYSLKGEDPDDAWVGWFGVDSKIRRQGFGGKLLKETIKLAQNRGNKRLRLWTTGQDSDDPKKEQFTTAANNLYDKIGFEMQATMFTYDFPGKIPVLIRSYPLDGIRPVPEFQGDYSKVFVGCTDAIKEYKGKKGPGTNGIIGRIKGIIHISIAKLITTKKQELMEGFIGKV